MYIIVCKNLVVKESILADTFLYIASGTGEEDIVGLLPLVLHRIFDIALLAHSGGLDKFILLGKCQGLLLFANLIMQ